MFFSVFQLRQYRIIGKKLSSTKDPNPPLYKMTIFAPDEVVAKSRFWYFTRRLKKIKKSAGEIVDIREIQENKPYAKVKNYGIWLRYNSRTGSHNMYREYRDISVANAVTSCCKWTPLMLHHIIVFVFDSNYFFNFRPWHGCSSSCKSWFNSTHSRWSNWSIEMQTTSCQAVPSKQNQVSIATTIWTKLSFSTFYNS